MMRVLVAATGLLLVSAPALSPGLAAAAPAAPAEGYALDRMELRAQLTPQRYTTLSAELGAKISRIAVREGERFRPGQSLVHFDCTLQTAQLRKAKAQLAAAENVHAGNRRLAELDAIGQVEFNNSEAELAKAHADVAYLRAVLDKCTISAPFAGRAGEQKSREQQFVQPGQAILEIIDDSALELEFIVPSRWLTWLRPGHRFKVKIDETGEVYPARLLRLAARADPVSQSVKAVAVIDGRFNELIAGMSGQILLSPEKSR
jgi:RND family efflux transporter MFP subunit